MCDVIHYVKGDLFDHYNNKTKTIILHSANKQGVMGSGFAKEFHRRFPFAFTQYKNDINAGMPLGDISVITDNQSLLVSAICQEFYGRQPYYRYVSYDAIETAFSKTIDLAIRYKYEKIIFPRIGAGLGGGDWRVISACINSAYDAYLGDPNKLKLVCYVTEDWMIPK